MLISILIPVFNFDITALAESLVVEISSAALTGKVEVILIDDASTNLKIQELNRNAIKGLDCVFVKYFQLEKNIGRSSIRNYLGNLATGEYLLFLDADMLPDKRDFLQKYFSYATEGFYDVVCGGISYRTRRDWDKRFDFYCYLSNKREAMSCDIRNAEPWRFLLTSNIMIRRHTFLSNMFDESFVGYGYEDVEWSIRLFGRYRIVHIDNTASHLGLMGKDECYERMVDSIPNLYRLIEKHPDYFMKIPIYRYVIVFSHMPTKLLFFLKSTLFSIFTRTSMFFIAFIAIQLSKTVLIAIKAQKNIHTLLTPTSRY